MVARDDGEGAARRRRERRLRSWLRHERLSVAMALSEFKHHSSRGQRKDRAGEEGHRDKYEAPRRQKPPPPQCSRPPCLGEPRGPQARIQQRTMEQLADVVPMVQILDTPVPQMVEQLLDVLRFFGFCLFPSRLSMCPRSCSMTSLCAPLCAFRGWRNSWWKCRRSYPILPCDRLRSSTSTFQFLVVEGDTLVFKVFLPDRVPQRCLLPPRNAFLSGLWSRSSIFPVEAFKIFAQDRVHPLLRTLQLALMMLWMRLVMGFSHFSPNFKKCEVGFALGVGTAPRVEPIHSVSSAPCSSGKGGEETAGGGGRA